MSEKHRGTLLHRDLEGGIFHLARESGEKLTLIGDARAMRPLVGAQVEVEGELEPEGGFGFAMTGPQLRVRAIRKL